MAQLTKFKKLQLNMDYLKPALFTVAPLIGALPGAYSTRKNIRWYNNLKHPSWHVARAVIRPAWTVLYSSIGFASYLVYRDGGGLQGPAKDALMLYGTQLALNFVYPSILMSQRRLGLAYAEILVLVGCTVGTVFKFRAVSETASNLMIPYLIWITYASFLNLWVWRNNKEENKQQ